MNVKKKKAMRGVSELVTIIAILLVAVVAVFAFRAWLASQQQRLGELDIASAAYTVQYTSPSSLVVSILVRNNMPNPVSVTGVSVVLSNGTVLTSLPGVVLPVSISAKSDAVLTSTLTVAAGTYVVEVRVQVQDTASGRFQWITAVGRG